MWRIPERSKKLGNNLTVCADTTLLSRLTDFLGEKNVKVIEKSIEKQA